MALLGPAREAPGWAGGAASRSERSRWSATAARRGQGWAGPFNKLRCPQRSRGQCSRACKSTWRCGRRPCRSNRRGRRAGCSRRRSSPGCTGRRGLRSCPRRSTRWGTSAPSTTRPATTGGTRSYLAGRNDGASRLMHHESVVVLADARGPPCAIGTPGARRRGRAVEWVGRQGRGGGGEGWRAAVGLGCDICGRERAGCTVAPQAIRQAMAGTTKLPWTFRPDAHTVAAVAMLGAILRARLHGAVPPGPARGAVASACAQAGVWGGDRSEAHDPTCERTRGQWRRKRAQCGRGRMGGHAEEGEGRRAPLKQ